MSDDKILNWENKSPTWDKDAISISNGGINISLNWISVKDRLPAMGIDILIVDNNTVKFGLYDTDVYGAKFYTTNFEQFLLTDNVTHWMPLPEPPQRGKKR